MSSNYKIVETEEVYEPIGPFSQAVIAGGFIFTAGIGGLEPETCRVPSNDVEEQTIQCMENVKNVLKAAGAELQDVIKAVIYLVNMDDYGKVNEIYARYMGEHRPARCCVTVKELPANELMKIEAIAIRK